MQSIKLMVEQATIAIQSIPVEDALSKIGDEAYQFVDIRDVRELQKSGTIPNAFHAPRGMLEFWVAPDSPYHKPIFAEDKTFIFFCASAWRSALAVKVLQDMGMARCIQLEGGFQSWCAQGGAIEKAKQQSKDY